MTRPAPVSLLGTERHTRTSKATGKEYEITIALPYTYVHDGLPGGPFFRTLPAWPVVYLTDSNWHMGMVTEFVREIAWCGRTTDAIVVGIGYPQGDSPQETWRAVSAFRANDLTPVHSDEDDKADSEWLNRPVRTGGGADFILFLKEELIPWVEQTYRADPTRRVLAGHSYGGLFALFAMFQEPGLFHTYIAASPYLRGSDRALWTMESEFAKTHQDLTAQLYLAVGELEESAEDTTVSDMLRLAAVLESRAYQGLGITRQVFIDNNHCEVVGPALHAGLRLALKR